MMLAMKHIASIILSGFMGTNSDAILIISYILPDSFLVANGGGCLGTILI